jgi:RNA polymerase sigma factor (sigma-70 family)
MGTTELEWLTRIVAERAAGLVLYARQWLDAATAEDVVQEALVALMAVRPQPTNPTAWMYRAVRNAAIDAVRSTSRRRRREQSAAAARPEWFEVRSDAQLDGQAAQEALEQLNASSREVVVLRIWGGLGFAEIAEVMQLAVSTVHDRYGKALGELRRELEKSCKTKLD